MASIDSILWQLESIGVFNYLLPFLLIFALTYGILSVSGIAGKQKGIHAIIAIVIGLMAIRLGFTQDFFSIIFPKLGIGLAVLLTLMILIGMFVSTESQKVWGIILSVVGVVIAIIIITQSFDNLGYLGFGGGWENYVGYIIGAVLLIGVIIAVILGGQSSSSSSGKPGISWVPANWGGGH
ncbi:MAG: hypothetical protein Q8L29_04255 [archaeon]|nr:hypothetical protein [archaeon]